MKRLAGRLGCRVAVGVVLLGLPGLGWSQAAAPVKKAGAAGSTAVAKKAAGKGPAQVGAKGKAPAVGAKGKTAAAGRASAGKGVAAKKAGAASNKAVRGKGKAVVRPPKRAAVAIPVAPAVSGGPRSSRSGAVAGGGGIPLIPQSARDERGTHGVAGTGGSGGGVSGTQSVGASEYAEPVIIAPAAGSAVPAAPVAAMETAEAGAFLYARQLDKFFAALAQLPPPAGGAGAVNGAQQTADPAGPTVRILQFGDSHTAADIFTGEMRAQLQARFGDGGLGYQYPGHPFAGYRLAGSTRSQTTGWATQGNKFTQLGDAETGLGGIAISTSWPGEQVSVETTCQTLQLQYLRQPGGGRLRMTDNGASIMDIDTGVMGEGAQAAAVETRSAATMSYACTPGPHAFTFTTLDEAPVRLLGLVTEQAGVTYECLGINGAVAPLILRWNQQMFGDLLVQRSPNLIVLAYGTNESMQSESYNDEYVAQFREIVQKLHRLVPGASVLVLGPYDHAIRAGRGRHALWRTSYAIDRIIADQKEVCRLDGCAYYDTRARMGGPGSIAKWVAEGLGQPDHTHLTGTGYRVLADAVYRDLMAAYERYLGK